MVSTRELLELFEYKDGGKLFGRFCDWRRKESNTRVLGKELGSKRPDGYLEITFTTKDGVRHKELVHRIIFQMHYGWMPELVDHIDMNRSNNNVNNLRSANKSINALNTTPRKNNRTGVKGVYQTKYGKYEASIWLNGKKNYLGLFSSVSEASLEIERFKSDIRRNEEIATGQAERDLP